LKVVWNCRKGKAGEEKINLDTRDDTFDDGYESIRDGLGGSEAE
jgi:hypothetical protein